MRMTTSTKIGSPAPGLHVAIDPAAARSILPHAAITAHGADPGRASAQVPSAAAEFESRIELRRAELIARLGEIRSDTRPAADQARDRMKAKLSELAHIIKTGVSESWANLSETVRHDLEHWLAESRRSMADQAPPGPGGQS